MLPLYGIGRTFSTHDGFVKIGCWRWHKKKPPEGAQSADKVRGAGGFPVAQSFALPCLSQISAFCALVARSPCICSHLRVALRCAQQPTGLTLPSGARMVSLPSQISAFCALAARSPCICSHLRVALRFAQQPTGLTLPSGALRVALGLRPKCLQGTRFPSRLPGFGAEPKTLCRSIFRERCERPRGAGNAVLSKTRVLSTV